ncbi:MAG TPA: homoserine O-succinyltransferase [Luteimonas sp.]|jgi:homoserine O-acetyltransferase|nr:homoserine O-succinyltransferase [Luteimonas sp.]
MSLATTLLQSNASPSRCPPPAYEPVSDHPRAARGVVECVLPLRHAGPRQVRIAYEWQGAVDAPVLLVAGGISAGCHLGANPVDPARGWWDAQVGTGRVLDPSAHRLLAIDWLGSDGALDVPIDPADQAAAIERVLDVLGIDRLAAFIGCSYGAMVGLQFAAAYGARLQQLVAISGTDRAHPYASAWRALQRRAVALGGLQCDESAGLALARELAMLGYRTPEEFAQRFAGPAQVTHGRVRCAAEDYLDACGQRFVERFEATAFLRLSESIDLHAVDAAAIAVPTTVVAVAEDRLVPVEDANRLVERLRAPTRLRVLRSIYGHDAFLKEDDAIAAILREALATGSAA